MYRESSVSFVGWGCQVNVISIWNLTEAIDLASHYHFLYRFFLVSPIGGISTRWRVRDFWHVQLYAVEQPSMLPTATENVITLCIEVCLSNISLAKAHFLLLSVLFKPFSTDSDLKTTGALVTNSLRFMNHHQAFPR